MWYKLGLVLNFLPSLFSPSAIRMAAEGRPAYRLAHTRPNERFFGALAFFPIGRMRLWRPSQP
jgi:hypothetical protein